MLLLDWSDNNDYPQFLKEQNEIHLNSEGWLSFSHDIQFFCLQLFFSFPWNMVTEDMQYALLYYTGLIMSRK